MTHQKSKSSWPVMLRNNSERIKNWAAMITSIAALIAAVGTSYSSKNNQVDLDVYQGERYEKIRTEITSISLDISRLSSDIDRLYRLRREEDRRRLTASELEKSTYEIEDRILRQYLTNQYGSIFADQFMDKRAKLHYEIRQEYVEGLSNERLPEPYNPPSIRELPPYDNEKN